MSFSRSFPLAVVLSAGIGLGVPSLLHSQSDSFESSRGMGLPPSRPLSATRLPIFFPPEIPPLDHLSQRQTERTNANRPAPLELADVINEPFYAPLGTRLALGNLKDDEKKALEAYHNEGSRLLSELRAELTRLQTEEPGARRRALEALAQRQAPALAALEQTAESLRQDLIKSGMGWGDLRQWHLGDKQRQGSTPAEIAQAMRGAAFYMKGFQPAQRRLLQEIAMEVEQAGLSAEAAAAAQPYLFFSPEPARIRLPDSIPATVASLVAHYQTQKSTLKKELYDTVYREDRAAFGMARTMRLKSLAEKQAPRFIALEKVAEDIRVALLGMTEPIHRRPSSPLPPNQTAQVASLIDLRNSLQKAAQTRIDEVKERSRNLPLRISTTFANDGLRYAVIPSRGNPGNIEQLKREAGKLNDELAAISSDYGQSLATFINDMNVLRRDIAQIVGDEKKADQALFAAATFVFEQKNIAAGDELSTALFEPGMAPGQRRLLFNAAVGKLNLPLPKGELQPTYRGRGF